SLPESARGQIDRCERQVMAAQVGNRLLVRPVEDRVDHHEPVPAAVYTGPANDIPVDRPPPEYEEGEPVFAEELPLATPLERVPRFDAGAGSGHLAGLVDATLRTIDRGAHPIIRHDLGVVVPEMAPSFGGGTALPTQAMRW